MLRKRFANFVNESVAEAPSGIFDNVWTAANEESKTRRVMLAPYGDWPNVQGLQRFKKQDAENIVNEFNRPTNVVKRTLGLPWYIGHPDHPGFASRYNDTKAYGRIKSLEAGDDGLYANVRFNTDGECLIADEAFHGHSVNWFLKEDGKGTGVWRPFRLKSVGFTNEPNIPVPPVTTANEEQTNKRWQTMANIRATAGVLWGNMWSDAARAASIEARKRAAAQSDVAAKASEKADNGGLGSDHMHAAREHIKASDAHLDAMKQSAELDDESSMSHHSNTSSFHLKTARSHLNKAEAMKPFGGDSKRSTGFKTEEVLTARQHRQKAMEAEAGGVPNLASYHADDASAYAEMTRSRKDHNEAMRAHLAAAQSNEDKASDLEQSGKGDQFSDEYKRRSERHREKALYHMKKFQGSDSSQNKEGGNEAPISEREDGNCNFKVKRVNALNEFVGAVNTWSDAARAAALEARRAKSSNASKLHGEEASKLDNDVDPDTDMGPKMSSMIAHEHSKRAFEEGSLSAHRSAAEAHQRAADSSRAKGDENQAKLHEQIRDQHAAIAKSIESGKEKDESSGASKGASTEHKIWVDRMGGESKNPDAVKFHDAHVRMFEDAKTQASKSGGKDNAAKAKAADSSIQAEKASEKAFKTGKQEDHDRAAELHSKAEAENKKAGNADMVSYHNFHSKVHSDVPKFESSVPKEKEEDMSAKAERMTKEGYESGDWSKKLTGGLFHKQAAAQLKRQAATAGSARERESLLSRAAEHRKQAAKIDKEYDDSGRNTHHLTNEAPITEGAADLSTTDRMGNCMTKMANRRKFRALVNSGDGYKRADFANSFGPWQDFEACLTHMEGAGGYDSETAKKVCGKLQAELE